MICNTELFTVLFTMFVATESRRLDCNLECRSGEECQLVRLSCNYPPCRRVPICVRTSEIREEMVRNGACPAPPVPPGPCMMQCRQDGDCPNSEKCCSNGCGQTCQPIQQVVASKPGTCPWHLRRAPLCGIDCENDSNCPGVEKCCVTSCGSMCSKPCYHWLRGTGMRSGYWSLPYICRRF